MTGPEHYTEAERLLETVKDRTDNEATFRNTFLAAQAHATLALAAATALAHQGPERVMMQDDRSAWVRAASEAPAAAKRRKEADAAEAAEYRREMHLARGGS